MAAEKDNTGKDASARRAPGRRQRPPVTLDLEAKPIEPEAATAPAETQASYDAEDASEPAEPGVAAPPVPPATARESDRTSPPSGPSAFGVVVTALLTALATLAIGLGVLASGLVTVPGQRAADQSASAPTELDAQVTALQDRLAALEEKTAAPTRNAELDSLAARVAALQASGDTISERIAQIEAAVARAGSESGSAAVRQEIDALGARVDRVAKAVGVEGTDSVPLIDEIAGQAEVFAAELKDLSARLDALAARPAPAVESERAARSVAIGVLRQAADEGAPFADDLAMLAAVGADAADLAALKPLAEKGAPSTAALAAEFPGIADAILLATSQVDPNAGFFDRVAGFGRSLVSVRPTAPMPGKTPDAIVSRMQAAVDLGDLSAALAEREALPAEGKAASADWAARAADRVAIDGLVARLVQSAAAPGGG
jgi:hypothetical protein